jgi:hypothetical protein
MKKFTLFMLCFSLLPFAVGCGGDKDRGMNRPDQRKDLPRAAPPEEKK